MRDEIENRWRIDKSGINLKKMREKESRQRREKQEGQKRK